MSIFSTILSKIFPSGHAATAPAAPAAPQTPTGSATTTAPSPAAPAATASAPASAMAPVDVEKILSDMAGQHAEKLNWRTSIVDLMKLLGLDSSLAARKELAAELHYTGDTGDSATMNIWLQKQVMNRLAANGGKVPEELRT